MRRDIVFAWPPGQLTTDPRLAYNGISKTYVRQVFESLVDIDPVTAQLRPWLASSWRRPDPLTVEVTVPPGRHFSDGRPLTAELVRNSFRDIMTDLADATPLPAAVAALTGLSAVESRGETVTFRSEGKEFSWTFNGLDRRPVDLAKIAPAGFTGKSLNVYVAQNPLTRN